MRVKQISVKNLFGVFDHIIPLNLEEHVTIIHGPNGFGKTVLLRMLYGLFRSNFTVFKRIPFESFQVILDDQSEYLVTKKATKRSRRVTSTEIEIHYSSQGGKTNSYSPHLEIPDRLAREIPPSLLDDLLPHLRRTGPREWFDTISQTSLSLYDVLELYGENLPTRKRHDPPPEWLQKVVPVYFVDTQRLIKTGTSAFEELRDRNLFREREALKVTQSVNTYSENLARRIQSMLAESAAFSQSLDRTFPSRLVKRKDNQDLTYSELRARLTDLEDKRSWLESLGFLDKDETEFQLPREPQHESRRVLDRVLSVYVEDVDKKLSIFDELAGKVGLFKQIIDSRFLYKELLITKEGFRCRADNGQEIPLAALSSGEQHEIVLTYDLLFNVEQGTLIFIDEPELSLHIAWQQQFLRDIKEIIRLSDFDVLIATHSPNIIHNRWDLTVQLTGNAS